MITLWVMPSGLNYMHNPDNPRLTDICCTTKLATLSDRVILQTKNGIFLRKPEKSVWTYGGPIDFTDTKDARVIFDPIYGQKTLEFKIQSPNQKDLSKFEEILKAVRGY